MSHYRPASTVYGKANGNGPLHILRPDGAAYCGVKRVHPIRVGPHVNHSVHRTCELAQKRALDAIPARSPEEIEAERRAAREELSDALWRLGIVL